MLVLGFRMLDQCIIHHRYSGQSMIIAPAEFNNQNVLRIQFIDDQRNFEITRGTLLSANDPRWPHLNPYNRGMLPTNGTNQ